MDLAYSPARSPDERGLAQRAFGLALVVLLHLLLLDALLQAVIHPRRPAAVREIFLRFIPHAPPKPEVAPPLPAAVLPSRRAVPAPPPPIMMPPATATPDLSGLGQSLFGCTPENLAIASPEVRSHCLSGLARTPENSDAPHDHVKNPERWANAIKERNAPPGQIPCTYIATTPTTGGAGGYHVPMVDPACLYKLLSH